MNQTLSNKIDVISPLDGKIISNVKETNLDDFKLIVEKAKQTFVTWSKVPIKKRADIINNYRELLKTNIEELSLLLQKENGKTFEESKAEIEKSIEVMEFSASIPQLSLGETLEVSKGINCQMTMEPLGVVASIVPLNFPSMVPHWTLGNAIVLGNTMVLKPSEHVPLSMMRTAELLKEAGLPDGVFNLVQGKQEIVEAICDHPDIQAVSFVGSTKVAKIVYKRASSNLKRALCLGGAKNHLLVLPDANAEMTSSNIIASSMGCAGQRCMAATTIVAVGNVDKVLSQVEEKARKIQVGKDIGAIVTKESKERIEKFITDAEKQGAKILLDGRNTIVEGKEEGFYVGPTIVDGVTIDMDIGKEEIFGPVLCIIRVATVDEAISIQNQSSYGNGASVYTQNGGLAEDVSQRLEAGMIGVNIGVPVPREPFSFGGIKSSKFGVGDITGKSSLNFFSYLKKRTVKWEIQKNSDWMS